MISSKYCIATDVCNRSPDDISATKELPLAKFHSTVFSPPHPSNKNQQTAYTNPIHLQNEYPPEPNNYNLIALNSYKTIASKKRRLIPMKNLVLLIATCIPLLSSASVHLIDDFSEGVTTNIVSTGSEVVYLDQTIDNIVGDPLFAQARRESASSGELFMRPAGADRVHFSGAELYASGKIAYGSAMYPGALSIYQSYDPASFVRITFATGFEPAGAGMYLVVTLVSGANTQNFAYIELSEGISTIETPFSDYSGIDFNDISGMSFEFAQFGDASMTLAVDKIEIISPLAISTLSANENDISMSFNNLNTGSSYAVLTTTNLSVALWSTSAVFNATSEQTNWTHNINSPCRHFKFEELP
jgi:hypothetical protein